MGEAIGDPTVYGLDAAAAGAFCALLWPRLRTREGLATGVLGAFLALLVAPHVPAGVPVLVAAGAAVVIALLPGSASPSPAAPETPREAR